MMTCVDLDLFYGKAIFGRMFALIEKTGTQPLTEKNVQGMTKLTDYLCLRNNMGASGLSAPGLYEPRHEKAGLRGFRPDPTLTRLYNHRR